MAWAEEQRVAKENSAGKCDGRLSVLLFELMLPGLPLNMLEQALSP